MKATSEQILMAATMLLSGTYDDFGAEGVKDEDIKAAIAMVQRIAKMVPEDRGSIPIDAACMAVQEILSTAYRRSLTRLDFLEEIRERTGVDGSEALYICDMMEKSNVVSKFKDGNVFRYCLKQDLIDIDAAAKYASENGRLKGFLYYDDFCKALKHGDGIGFWDLGVLCGIIGGGHGNNKYVGPKQE